MRPTPAFLYVLIFSGHLVVSTHGTCGPDKYPVSKYPGGKCLKCAKCQEGQGLVPKCGTPIVYQVDKIDCEPCEPGKFSDKYDSSSCYVCHQCAENENSVPCNSTSDTVCNGTCKKGFYFSKKDGTHSCQKCSQCCFDDQDEEVAECKEQGFTESKQYCAPRPDKDCAPPPHAPGGGKHGSDSSNNNKLSQILLIVFTVTVTVVTVAIACFCRKRKEIRNNNQIPPPQNADSERTSNNGQVIQNVASLHEDPLATEDPGANNATSASCGSASREKNILTRQKSKDSQKSGAPQNADSERTSNNGQVIRNVASLHEDLPDTNDPGANNATSAKCGSASHEKNILTRQKSKDSQKSGALQNADSERTSNNGQVIRNVASLHEDPPDTEDPGANNATSASCEKNILTCQKSKDSQKNEGDDADAGNHQRSSSFSNLEENFKKRMPIKRQGSLVHNEEQDTDEVPEYKSLKDVHRQDFQTYERVGRLLSQKKHGLGGWREVAFKYKMNDLDIDALGNDPEAGSKTLDFLGSVVPGLTVYDFCKTLKEHNIRRLDIVQELENHFSATGTAFV